MPREWTIEELYKSGGRVGRGTRLRPADSKDQNLRKVIPYPAFRSVLFQFEHYGLTVKSLHQVFLMFSGLEITEEVRPPETHIPMRYKDKVYYVQKPSLRDTKVVVRCSCPDFYFTFAYYNWQRGALFGRKPKPYHPKGGRGRPRNPDHYPGACKHILNSSRDMITAKLVNPDTVVHIPWK